MTLRRYGAGKGVTKSSVEDDVTLGPGFRPATPYDGCYPAWQPAIEVFETKHELVVRAELAGVATTQLGVQLKEDDLVIRGERGAARPRDARLYHEARIRYGAFFATVRLPFPIDSSAASAEYIDGFLTVTLPRLAATRITPKSNTGSRKPGRRTVDEQV